MHIPGACKITAILHVPHAQQLLENLTEDSRIIDICIGKVRAVGRIGAFDFVTTTEHAQLDIIVDSSNKNQLFTDICNNISNEPENEGMVFMQLLRVHSPTFSRHKKTRHC